MNLATKVNDESCYHNRSHSVVNVRKLYNPFFLLFLHTRIYVS